MNSFLFQGKQLLLPDYQYETSYRFDYLKALHRHLPEEHLQNLPEV